ncbi:hypothetical protein [Caulobacter sp. S45]|uniref:hypothetical protein n=1 Tax=Caulobacter sp. S45 TaxID=1641861 RepID=UPI00157668BA|nr:hypothetical protein [Caulobacter sp. S45]
MAGEGLQDVDLRVRCLKCGKKATRSVGRLEQQRHFTCRECGTEFRVSAHRVQEEVVRLKELGKDRAQTLRGRE